MTFRETGGKTPRYFVDGLEVTKKTYEHLMAEEKDKLPKVSEGESGSSLLGPWNQPVLSDGMAVHPSQVEEARERDRKAGVPTDYTPDGRPILRSQAHKRAFMKSFGKDVGLHERNCYC